MQMVTGLDSGKSEAGDQRMYDAMLEGHKVDRPLRERQSGSDRWQKITASPPNITIEVRAGLARLLDPPSAITRYLWDNRLASDTGTAD
jgi:hypothetical protein